MKIPDRQHYPQEVEGSWLTVLLDSYAICDEEMEREISDEEKKRDTKVACKKGCYFCCLNQDVPVTPPESLGISWYVSEVLEPSVRERLRERLKDQAQTIGCPFLKDGACVIYPVRPLACRLFIIYRIQCRAEDEDPFFTRPEDMHPTNPDRNLRIAMRFLDSPVYNLSTKKGKIAAYQNGIMYKSIPGMHKIRWLGFIDATEGMIF